MVIISKALKEVNRHEISISFGSGCIITKKIRFLESHNNSFKNNKEAPCNMLVSHQISYVSFLCCEASSWVTLEIIFGWERLSFLIWWGKWSLNNFSFKTISIVYTFVNILACLNSYVCLNSLKIAILLHGAPRFKHL